MISIQQSVCSRLDHTRRENHLRLIDSSCTQSSVASNSQQAEEQAGGTDVRCLVARLSDALPYCIPEPSRSGSISPTHTVNHSFHYLRNVTTAQYNNNNNIRQRGQGNL